MHGARGARSSTVDKHLVKMSWWIEPPFQTLMLHPQTVMTACQAVTRHPWSSRLELDVCVVICLDVFSAQRLSISAKHAVDKK